MNNGSVTLESYDILQVLIILFHVLLPVLVYVLRLFIIIFSARSYAPACSPENRFSVT